MTRYIQIPIPSVALLSPFIDTPLISVSHILQVKIQAGTRRTKVSLPITICGFPWHALDLDGRQSLEALPLYEPLESEPPQQLSSAIVTTTDETLDAEEDQVLAVGPEDDGPDERTTDLTETLVEATSDPTMESTIEGRDIVQVATVSSTTTAVTSPTTTRPGSVHSSSGSVKEV